MKERGNKVLRVLDRYLGIPLVFFLGCFKLKRTLKKQERIALLITGGIGDTVLLSAIVQDLKGKEVTLFTSGSNAEMARLIPGVSVVSLSLVHFFASLKKIRKSKFDVWIDANPWPRINALFSFFCRADVTIGYKRKGQHRHYVYDFVVEHKSCCHELENMRNLLGVLNISAQSLPFIPLKRGEKVKNQIVLHLFAGGSRAYLKEWPEAKWIRLMEALSEKGCFLVLTGAGADKTRLEAIKALCSFSNQIKMAAGELSLEETALLLSCSEAAVSVDTGIMHLAAAVGCPLVSLHGPTSPSRWGALGKQVISLQWEKAYEPCIQLGFEKKCRSNFCMQGIEVSSVLNALSIFCKTS